MKMTIARALKEKNRLVGRINQVRCLVTHENVKSFSAACKEGEAIDEKALYEACNRRRKVDVAKLEAEWRELEEKLIRLKTAIQKANAGAVETLVRLQEAKSHLSQLDSVHIGEDEVSECLGGRVSVITAVFGVTWQLAEKERYTKLVNELQDKIDEYNAITSFEFDL